MVSTPKLLNFARGGKSFHAHRLDIVRSCLSDSTRIVELSPFLRDSLFQLKEDRWRAFVFGPKDWEVAARLLLSTSVDIEEQLLALAVAYIEANLESVAKMYALSDSLSRGLLRETPVILETGADLFSRIDQQSLFAFRVFCATNQKSSQAMRQELEKVFKRGGWCHSRLMFPLINLVTNHPSPAGFDNFLAYFAVGNEHPAEMLALKLLLSDVAGRRTSLAFKTYIGLVGHPFDACEFILDHAEFILAAGRSVPPHIQTVLARLAVLLPHSRVARLSGLIERFPRFALEGPEESNVRGSLADYGIEGSEPNLLTRFAKLAPLRHVQVQTAELPLAILENMRASEYPVPEQFHLLLSARTIWSFIDGGRIIGALMRSVYMVDRTDFDLEGRDVLRLVSLLGCINPMVASAPSAMPLFRRLQGSEAIDPLQYKEIETGADQAIKAAAPLRQRLWINELQWRLRRLEEEGRVQEWLGLVRTDAKVRPLYLTGINWPWVEEIIAQQRLKPFRSFDGAYLLLLMEMESNSDPLRLKLVLDRLLEERDFETVVATLLQEYGEKAPAFLRRYLTSSNLLSSGLAANHFAALDQRIKALEEGIRTLGFGPLLTKEMYESEVRLLTAELLLLNVNVGKFEVPWDAFQKDVIDHYRDQYDSLINFKLASDEETLAAIVETPKLFKNGRKEQYRYRRNNSLLFQLIVQIIEDFLDHPAFGLEVILSGRFRHNNLLQELQATMTTVEAADIHPVTHDNVLRLSAAYHPVLEQILYEWCTTRLHSRRGGKPDALFDLIPSPAEMTDLIQSTSKLASLEALARSLVVWLKEKLRPQVAEAGRRFVDDLKPQLTDAFARLREEQIAGAGSVYRVDDARRIHNVILDAVLRRVEALKAWFDGVDTTSATRPTLAQLSHATEALFEHMMPGRSLATEPDLEAAGIRFEPAEVKIAFDLVREIAFNALKHGPDGDVRLSIARQYGPGPVTFVFSNPLAGGAEASSGKVLGHRYESVDEALTREGNSGRLKIAASAATLAGEDTQVEWESSVGRYSLIVPLRPPMAAEAA